MKVFLEIGSSADKFDSIIRRGSIACLECPEPPSQPQAPRYPTSGLFSEEDIPVILSKADYA